VCRSLPRIRGGVPPDLQDCVWPVAAALSPSWSVSLPFPLACRWRLGPAGCLLLRTGVMGACPCRGPVSFGLMPLGPVLRLHRPRPLVFVPDTSVGWRGPPRRAAPCAGGRPKTVVVPGATVRRRQSLLMGVRRGLPYGARRPCRPAGLLKQQTHSGWGVPSGTFLPGGYLPNLASAAGGKVRASEIVVGGVVRQPPVLRVPPIRGGAHAFAPSAAVAHLLWGHCPSGAAPLGFCGRWGRLVLPTVLEEWF
jgi:hypothetical protein